VLWFGLLWLVGSSGEAVSLFVCGCPTVQFVGRDTQDRIVSCMTYMQCLSRLGGLFTARHLQQQQLGSLRTVGSRPDTV
jgi:hypothetical protein